MTNPNLGYVFEIAGMMVTAERTGLDSEEMHDAAIENGVTEEQLKRARGELLGLRDTSDDGLAAHVYRIYVEDGLKNGYVAAGDESSHSLWVISQLAWAHHGR